MAIAVGIHGLRHLLIGSGIIKECANFVDNLIVVGAYKMNSAALDGIGSLGGVAHHENGLAEARSLLLNATRISEDDCALLHQIDELKILQGFNEEKVVSLTPSFSR